MHIQIFDTALMTVQERGHNILCKQTVVPQCLGAHSDFLGRLNYCAPKLGFTFKFLRAPKLLYHKARVHLQIFEGAQIIVP